MRMIDAINNVDRSPANTNWVNMETIAESLGVNYCYTDANQTIVDARFKEYTLVEWLCTDTGVGVMVYYLDDVPVAISTQIARKEDINVKYLSKETAAAVRDFIFSLEQESRETVEFIEDLNEEIGDSYKVNYSSQVVSTMVPRHNGKMVKVVKIYPGYSDSNWKTVDIEEDGKILEKVPLTDIEFLYHVKEPTPLALPTSGE